MKGLAWALMLTMLGAAPCRAENASSLVSQDPLTAQIRLRQLTEPNGGVTGFRVDPQGKVVKIEVVDLSGQPVGGLKPASPIMTGGSGVLAGLKPHPGLTPRDKAHAKGKAIEAPKAQLDHVDGKKKW